MTDRNHSPNEHDALLHVHNELAREANEAKVQLEQAKADRGVDELMEDPRVNYLQGKVIGYDMATSALHAHIAATRELSDADIEAFLTEE